MQKHVDKLYGQIDDRVAAWHHDYSRASARECIKEAIRAAVEAERASIEVDIREALSELHVRHPIRQGMNRALDVVTRARRST